MLAPGKIFLKNYFQKKNPIGLNSTKQNLLRFERCHKDEGVLVHSLKLRKDQLLSTGKISRKKSSL